MKEPETDHLARFSAAIGFAVLFVGIARALALDLSFPGGEPGHGVVGWTAVHDYNKGSESGFFYYSMILAPIGMAIGYWISGLRLIRGSTGGDSVGRDSAGGAWLFAGTGASIAWIMLTLIRPIEQQSWSRLAVIPAILLLGALAAAAIHRRLAIRIDFAGWCGRLAGLGSTVAAGVSLAVFLLSVGPKVPVPAGMSQLGLHSFRIAGVVAASIAIAVGIAWLITSVTIDRSARPETGNKRLVSSRTALAMRPFTFLLLARLAPTSDSWVLFTIGIAAVGSLASMVLSRPRRESDTQSNEEIPTGADTDNRPVGADHDLRFFKLFFLPALVAALVFHEDVNGSLDLFHFGEWLTPGAEMLRGQMPFRDLYLQHGLIQNALRSFATFSLFEPTFEFDRLSNNLMFGLTHGAFVVLGVFLFRSWITAVVLALVLATPAAFSGESGLFLQPRFFGFLLALAFVLRDLRQARDEHDGSPRERTLRWPLISSGAAAALATFWSLDSGVYAVLTACAFLFLESLGRKERLLSRAKPFLTFGAGYALGAAPFVLWLVSIDAIGAFLQNSQEQIAYQMGVWGIPYPSFRETLSRLRPNSYGVSPGQAIANGRVIALVAVSTFVLIPCFLMLRALKHRAIPTIGYRVLLLTIAGAALFRTALGRSDPNHLSYAGAILWPTLIALGEHALLQRRSASSPATPWLKTEPGARALLRVAPLMLVAGWLMTGWAPLYSMNKQWTRLSAVRPIKPGGGFVYCPLPSLENVLIPRAQAQVLTSVAAVLDERLEPGETFIDPSNIGAVYFLTGRPVPSQFYYAVYAATPEMQRRMIEDLEESRPRLMIRCKELGFEEFDGVPMAERTPVLAAYLASHYQLVSDEGFAQIFERTDEPG